MQKLTYVDGHKQGIADSPKDVEVDLSINISVKIIIKLDITLLYL